MYHLDQYGEKMGTTIQPSPGRLLLRGLAPTVLIGGVEQPDSRRGAMTLYLKVASTTKVKVDALKLVGRSSPTWAQLYNAYELVESDVGGRMFTDGWISKSGATIFRRTANSYKVLGEDARHGDPRFDAPDKPMERQTAVDLIRSLVKAWLQDSSVTGSP